MASVVDNLWPNDIEGPSKQSSPVGILKQQALLLGKRTKNLVEADVETRATDFQRFLQHSFYLVAPALDFYKYLLFRIEHHPTQFYPLKIIWDKSSSETSRERKLSEKKRGATLAERAKERRVKSATSELSASSEAEFKEHLKRIFGDDDTKKVIQSLIDQSVG